MDDDLNQLEQVLRDRAAEQPEDALLEAASAQPCQPIPRNVERGPVGEPAKPAVLGESAAEVVRDSHVTLARVLPGDIDEHLLVLRTGDSVFD